MKLQEVVTMIDIKEHWQIWSISYLIKKQDREHERQAK